MTKTFIKVSIQDQIRIATLAVEAGVIDDYILFSLHSDGITKVRAETILRWAKQGAQFIDDDTIIPEKNNG